MAGETVKLKKATLRETRIEFLEALKDLGKRVDLLAARVANASMTEKKWKTEEKMQNDNLFTMADQIKNIQQEMNKLATVTSTVETTIREKAKHYFDYVANSITAKFDGEVEAAKREARFTVIAEASKIQKTQQTALLAMHHCWMTKDFGGWCEFLLVTMPNQTPGHLKVRDELETFRKGYPILDDWVFRVETEFQPSDCCYISPTKKAAVIFSTTKCPFHENKKRILDFIVKYIEDSKNQVPMEQPKQNSEVTSATLLMAIQFITSVGGVESASAALLAATATLENVVKK